MEQAAEQVKRGRGRPKGSRNRRREEAALAGAGAGVPMAQGLAAGVVAGPSALALDPPAWVRLVMEMLVQGAGLIEIGTQLRAQGIGAGEAVALLGEARAHLAGQAAMINQQAELGLALARLDKQYELAGDLLDSPQTAPAALGRMLAIQRERQALVGLGQAGGAGEDGGAVAGVGDAQAELAAVAGCLIPLALAPAGAPLREHARLAAYAVQRAKMERA